MKSDLDCLNPKITIGMPVYNSEKFIKQSIDSILTQTFTDFELIISDNASTDSTSNICKNYEKIDKRIKYIRHEKNRGQSFNFTYVLSEAKTKYFVWLAADDYWHSTFLEKNISILESNNNVVGSIGLVKFYGVEGWKIKNNFMFKLKNYLRRNHNEKYIHVMPAFGPYKEKSGKYLRFNQGSFTYGLFRTEKLKKRIVSVDLPAWDLILILNILKEGDLHVVDEILLYRFVSGVHSEYGLLSFYKKGIFSISDIIIPYSSLSLWCIKNIGFRFFIKNIDWFILLTIYGWRSILLEILDQRQK